MADQNDQRQLDDLLDSALSAYSAVEPRPGLEARILARIQESERQPNLRWWSIPWLAGATAAAIAVLILGILFFRPPQKLPKAQVKTPEPMIHDLRPKTSQPDVGGPNAKLVPHPERRVRHVQVQQQELAQRDR